MADLFSKSKESSYSAKDIEVLEGLEPVRRRPGMYIGGTDAGAMHHLAAEILDNSMDEVVAGHADRIEVELHEDNVVTIRDNGRGIPVDPHPKFKKKSALEVILTTLHSGGKFGGKVYDTSGGLHGVGSSVVNALSDSLLVEVARERKLWTQSYVRGVPKGPLKDAGAAPNRRGTTITFHPDPQIFGDKADVSPAQRERMARSPACRFRGVDIRWKVDKSLLHGTTVPEEDTLHFPGGLADFLASNLEGRETLIPAPFEGTVNLNGDDAKNGGGKVEWAVNWVAEGEGLISSYCNTIPTPQGGTHEAGLRGGLSRALKAYGDLAGNRRAAQITADDVMDGACCMLSLFMRDPQFQGQTKEKLASVEAAKMVESTIKDHFDHWLSGDPTTANQLLESIIARAEERLREKKAKEFNRKTATRKLRLPGKLADCARSASDGTEIFLVEGDSAGGSA